MATVFWIGNAQATAQVNTYTVTAVAVAGTLTMTINNKTIVYTCITGDTITTATAAWLALLQASTTPPEFQEITWTASSTDKIVATSTVAGQPFTATASGAGGATVSTTATTANSSPNDVGDAKNYRRNGSASLPQNGDDFILQNSTVSMLWNCDALSAIKLATFKRWQSFTGAIGLPDYNPAGYYEYRATRLILNGPDASTFPVTLGLGTSGGGPSRERYSFTDQDCTIRILAGGGGGETGYAVDLIGTASTNLLYVTNTSLIVAGGPAETSAFTTFTADGGANVSLGAGVTVSGTLTLDGASAFLALAAAPTTLKVINGATATVESASTFTFATVTLTGGSSLNWWSSATITTLAMKVSSTFSKTNDLNLMTITNCSIDGDTCQIQDPNNTITFTNPITVNNTVQNGPFVFGSGRTVAIA